MNLATKLESLTDLFSFVETLVEDVDQDWINGITYFKFYDGSVLGVSGSDFFVVNKED